MPIKALFADRDSQTAAPYHERRREEPGDSIELVPPVEFLLRGR
ncbi:MAG: hypothetical protein V4564_05910 [Pseudomonadota bacterium]|nr:hypothetical protein [Sphingomonas sp. ERG5]